MSSGDVDASREGRIDKTFGKINELESSFVDEPSVELAEKLISLYESLPPRGYFTIVDKKSVKKYISKYQKYIAETQKFESGDYSDWEKKNKIELPKSVNMTISLDKYGAPDSLKHSLENKLEEIQCKEEDIANFIVRAGRAKLKDVYYEKSLDKAVKNEEGSVIKVKYNRIGVQRDLFGNQ